MLFRIELIYPSVILYLTCLIYFFKRKIPLKIYLSSNKGIYYLLDNIIYRWFKIQGGFIIMEVLKVATSSSPNKVAGALAGVLRENGRAELQAVGAGAVNQSVKAIAIARGFVASSGVNLISIPAFIDIEIDGEERTAIKFIVEPR